MYLILWDIDGTLVSCGPQVRPIFAGALEDVYGTTGDIAGYDFAGKTDPGIVRDLMTGAGVGEPTVRDRLPLMHDTYLDRLDAGLERAGMRLMPHVEAVLERLAARPDVAIGLLTGNWRRGARIKLGRFGLDRHLDFGGFGDAGFVRHDLYPPALAAARQATGVDFAPDRVLIVGDSLLDVASARYHGAATLAVATGWTSAAALAAAGAEWVVPDLADFDAPFEEFVAGAHRSASR
jgi:phosphoglycolate phosphatase-like HAD superfamily hydrolase